MQRFHNIGKWFEVDDGKAVNFGNPDARLVRLDVNSADAVALDYIDGNGEVTFLARVLGRDVLEFRSEGEFSIIPRGGPVSMYTIDGEDISFSIPDAVKITKLAERRARNPEIEMMQYQMNRNIQERMNAVRDEMERVFNQRVAAIEASAKQPAPAAPSVRVPGEPAPDKSAEGSGSDLAANSGTGNPA